jgi:drug/metabolite transporter (DMT)-like permease
LGRGGAWHFALHIGGLVGQWLIQMTKGIEMIEGLPSQIRAVAALALEGVIWGTSDVASKIALEAMSPLTLTALRFGVAALVLWPLARRSPMPTTGKGQFFLLGLFGVAGAYLLQNTGLERTRAASASMLQAAAPVLVVAGAAVFLREPLDWFRITGTLVALAGVVAITLRNQSGFAALGGGELYIVGSAACFAAFVLIGRRLFLTYDVIPVLTLALTWALVIVAPFAMFEVASQGVAPWSPSTMALVLYLGAGCSALTYFLWGYALRYLEASQAAVFDNIVPVVGVIAATLLLQEQVSSGTVLGGLLVLGGTWLVSRPSPPAAELQLAPEIA